MKAEHRKELQTNTLADNLGRLIEGLKHIGRRTFLLILLVTVAVLAFIVWRVISEGNKTTLSYHYYLFDNGNRQLMLELVKDDPNSGPGKAARFQLAWIDLWELGIKPLATEPMRAQLYLSEARDVYSQLAKDCTNDPSLASEANYALALIEESLVSLEQKVAKRVEQLDKAVSVYKSVSSDSPGTAHGKLAADRANYIEKNRSQVLEFYDKLAERLSPQVIQIPGLEEFMKQQKQLQQEKGK
jgi:hypothetical protein